jgi:hypothetical protein
LFPEFIEEAPHKDTGIIIVVPAYDEPGISFLLGSLALCTEPPCITEVVIVVNAPRDATGQSLDNNRQTLENILIWKKKNPDCFFRIHSVEPSTGNYKKWGVGLARKCGMDEAVRRFEAIGREDGIILNLDADCSVESNYLIEVYKNLSGKKDRDACSIYFEHPLSGTSFPLEVYRNITLYELHLRYYYQALVFSGFPEVFHTVGSATAVKALPYVRAGGMNRKQAGEDFYFIQKLIPAGGYFSLNTTIVHPSPRSSSRVPFGTGASMEKMASAGERTYLTYNFEAFRQLRAFFDMVEQFYNTSDDDLYELYNMLPPAVRSFACENELRVKIREFHENTSGYKSFRKRFFVWFNMFRVVKYLNHLHSGMFMKTDVTAAASELLREKGIVLSGEDTESLLLYFRSVERGD